MSYSIILQNLLAILLYVFIYYHTQHVYLFANTDHIFTTKLGVTTYVIMGAFVWYNHLTGFRLVITTRLQPVQVNRVKIKFHPNAKNLRW